MSATQDKVEQLGSKAQKLDKKLDNETKKLKKPAKAGQVHYPFWFGGSAASMAAVCTHPLDLSTAQRTPIVINVKLTNQPYSQSPPPNPRPGRAQNYRLDLLLHPQERGSPRPLRGPHSRPPPPTHLLHRPLWRLRGSQSPLRTTARPRHGKDPADLHAEPDPHVLHGRRPRRHRG